MKKTLKNFKKPHFKNPISKTPFPKITPFTFM
jgi:hypothetical protein